jgi:predicted PurR-regulated permease PerM
VKGYAIKKMNMIHRGTASVLFTIVVFTLLLALIYQARRPLAAFIFAILFAYLLEPLVARFQTWLRGSRGLAVAATYLLLGTAIAAFGITAGPRILKQAERLGQELPALIENVGSGEIVQEFGSQRGWDYKTQLQVQRFLIDRREVIAQYAQSLADWAAGFAGSLMWLLLIPILAAFLLRDNANFADAFLKLIENDRQRGFLRLVMKGLDAMLATFIRAQLLLSALALVAYTSFLLLAQFPYGFAFGAIAGLLEFIPFVGPMVAALLILGMAILTGYEHWLVVLVFLILWRGIQDYVTTPYLMGRGLELHPLAVIFGVLVGGEIAGVMGLFLSVPIMAGLRIIWKAWRIQPGENEITPVQLKMKLRGHESRKEKSS